MEQMTLEQAIKFVKKASTGKGQLAMSHENWTKVPEARKIVAEHFVKIMAAVG